MDHNVPPEIPPLFEELRRSEPGLLYYLASKPHLMSGAGLCNRNLASRLEWGHADKRELRLHFVGGNQVTFRVENGLVPHCTCNLWTRQSQCPHVVAAWIQLKRLLSPSSFPQIKIDGWVLRDLADLTGLPAPLSAGPPEEQRATRELAVKDSRPPVTRATGTTTVRRLVKKLSELAPIRFVLEKRYDGIRGAFRRGPEELSYWMTGLPRDVAQHIRRYPFFEASLRYFTALDQATKGKYPIVLRDSSGRETVLTFSVDQPLRACISFVLRDGKVTIARTTNGAAPLSPEVVAVGEVLLDPAAQTISPLTNAAIWRLWDNLEQTIMGDSGPDEWANDDEEGYGVADDRNDDADDPVSCSSRHVIEASLGRFNELALRLFSGAIPGFGDSVLFYCGATQVDCTELARTDCRLELETIADATLIRVAPRITFDGCAYPFSLDLFRYFNSGYRSSLTPPLKAKKRVRALAGACLELAAAPTPAARRQVIRSALSGPDYLKRSVKHDARRILNGFAEDMVKKPLMIQTRPDGWSFAEDDRMVQTRMMAILYELMGYELLDGWELAGEALLARDQVLAVLPRLAERLGNEGFELVWDGSALVSAEWDFTLDATNSSLDWFELRPEIRCDGELVGDEELRLLAEGGVLQRHGRLILVDDNSARVLGMLAGILGQPKRKKKTVAQPPARIPRLQILDWLQMRAHGVTVRLAPQDARVLENLINFETIPRRALPGCLTATLRPYQQDGYIWLGFLYEHRFGACLADDMGLGKTVQSISLLCGIADGVIADACPEKTPHLVVVPPSLLFNWEGELARFFPGARVLLYGGQGRTTGEFGRYDIILTSYGIVQRDIEKLADLSFNVIIFDEAQLVKNLQAATTSAARRLKGSFKLALTGTPVENRIGEYCAIMDLCLPGLLGTPEQYKHMLAERGEAGIQRLLSRTRPFVLRRNKQLIAADLPEKVETDIHLELSPKQKALYQRTIEEVRGQIDEAFSNRAPGQARIIALTALLRLRQICLAPSLALAGAPDVSPKLDFLIEQLAELREEGHSVLVFSQFTSFLDIVETALRRHHFSCLRLDGSTPTAQRKHLVQAFQKSEEPRVFLISLKAGGKGLNLTRATYVYHLDPWWNPAVENQASDRAHRIGQTRRVTITRLVMRHTIEEKMMLLKEQKLKLYKAILEDGTGAGGTGLTREDFAFLLG